MLGSSEQDNLVREGVHIENKDKKNMSSNVKQCLFKVADGHLITNVKVLGPSIVSPYNGNTKKTLEAKQPYIPPVAVNS